MVSLALLTGHRDFLMMGVINNTASQIIMLRQRPQVEKRGVRHKMHSKEKHGSVLAAVLCPGKLKVMKPSDWKVGIW